MYKQCMHTMVQCSWQCAIELVGQYFYRWHHAVGTPNIQSKLDPSGLLAHCTTHVPASTCTCCYLYHHTCLINTFLMDAVAVWMP